MADQRRVCLWFWMQSSMAAHRGGVGLSFPAVSFLFAAMCACCLFVPRRGDYISGTANTRVLIKLLLGFMVFIDRVRLLADRLDRSAIGGIRSDFTQSEVMGLNSEYVPLLFIPLKLVSSVYSLLKPSGKSVSRRRRGV